MARPKRRGARAVALAVAGSVLVTFAVSSTPADATFDPVLGYDAELDMGGLNALGRITGADLMWERGVTGRGVDVAVIDTGVARVPGLDRPGQVIDGPDLSFDSQDAYLAHTDAFGHGTHMAGIIAGNDVAPNGPGGCRSCRGRNPYTDETKFVGIAPESRIVNVKVGAFDGAVDVSQVIAGIDWVVQHRNAPQPGGPALNIKVISLSFGTDSMQAADVDPLVHAVEVAWRAGIVVVVASGNDGRAPGPMGNPAISPLVIAVGASNPGKTESVADDVIARFAEHGTAERPVDIVAPGMSVISLRVPGGFVDLSTTSGKVGTRFQRGSGTSQSTAVVAGLAALLIQQYPDATPDQIKSALKANAKLLKPAGAKSWYAGAGSAFVGSITNRTPLPLIPPQVARGTGLGSLELARGSYHLVDAATKTALVGEIDIFGAPWVASTMAALTEARATWIGGTWNGTQWTSAGFSLVDSSTAAWTSATWAGARWTGARWTGVTWSSASWSGARWSDMTWDGARWSGARWSDMTWDGARWSGARWSGARWTSGEWEGARWSGARWSDNGWS
jgi:serine protease AprX